MIITDRELEIVCLIADRHRTLEKKVLCRVQISRLFHSYFHFHASFPEVLTENVHNAQCTYQFYFIFLFLVSVVLIRNNVII